MKDDAVAPIIAVMLILASVVTLFALFNGIYIPSLKQAAETEHLRNVESAFQHFSSDFERAVAAGQDRMTTSEPVQLGGGDIFLNTLKSGGSLTVTEEQVPVYSLMLYDGDGMVMGRMNGTLVNISYNPVGNFWQEQGYRWQYGYLNVTKYGRKQAPLGYYTMADVNNAFSDTGSLAAFAGSFGDAEYIVNQTLLQNSTPTPDNRFVFSSRAGNCSSIIIRAVNLTASPDRSFASGNGFGRLELKSRVTPVPYYGVSAITIGSFQEPFGNATFRNLNESFTTMAGVCKNNIRYHPEYSGDGFSLFTIEQQVNPVNVTLNIITIEVGAY
jgi:FlaG/FlaF family flagellin (archaellin)